MAASQGGNGDKSKSSSFNGKGNTDNTSSVTSPLLWLAALQSGNGQVNSLPPEYWTTLASTIKASSDEKNKDSQSNGSSPLTWLPYLMSSMPQPYMSAIGNMAATYNTKPGFNILDGMNIIFV